MPLPRRQLCVCGTRAGVADRVASAGVYPGWVGVYPGVGRWGIWYRGWIWGYLARVYLYLAVPSPP